MQGTVLPMQDRRGWFEPEVIAELPEERPECQGGAVLGIEHHCVAVLDPEPEMRPPQVVPRIGIGFANRPSPVRRVAVLAEGWIVAARRSPCRSAVGIAQVPSTNGAVHRCACLEALATAMAERILFPGQHVPLAAQVRLERNGRLGVRAGHVGWRRYSLCEQGAEPDARIPVASALVTRTE
jgi:hypothetical protein